MVIEEWRKNGGDFDMRGKIIGNMIVVRRIKLIPLIQRCTEALALCKELGPQFMAA